MACCTVDDGVIGDVFPIMNYDCPDVDEGEKEDIGSLLEGEDEGEGVVGEALGPPVKGVKGVRGEG